MRWIVRKCTQCLLGQFEQSARTVSIINWRHPFNGCEMPTMFTLSIFPKNCQELRPLIINRECGEFIKFCSYLWANLNSDQLSNVNVNKKNWKFNCPAVRESLQPRFADLKKTDCHFVIDVNNFFNLLSTRKCFCINSEALSECCHLDTTATKEREWNTTPCQQDFSSQVTPDLLSILLMV